MTALPKIEPRSENVLNFALDYAHRGWAVFPCRPQDKRPYTASGFKEASTDELTVKRWWQQWPHAMIGVRMGEASGVWAIDPDAPEKVGDPDGRAAWAQLLAKHGDVHTHAHLTPGGGHHLLFKWDADRPVTNREGALKGSGINVRGQGGYIIAPPSVRADGKSYQIAEPLDFFNFADAPEWLYELILTEPAKCSISERAAGQVRPREPRNRSYAEAALRGECEAVATSRDGERNNTLNTAALKLGSLVGAGELSEGEVIGALYAAAVACGYVADEGHRATMATVNSGLQAGIKQPREIPDRDPHKSGQAVPQSSSKAPPAALELLWHGQAHDRASRSWLVKTLLPEKGQGLASGQWGGCKTFGVCDLSGSVMTGLPFADRQVDRQGGVLFIAAEGASEIPIRLRGLVEHKLRPAALSSAASGTPVNVDLDNLPFAWIEECPSLKDDQDFNRIVDAANVAANNIKTRFELPLALIVIDTLNAAANFKDGNDAAEGQQVMNRLGELSRLTGAFVLAVDHFGKAVETGTRGTSAKEAAADVVLAFLADRDIAGNISNTRMAVRKLRAGATGSETPFDLKVVDLAGETTCVIEWKQEGQDDHKLTSQRERWPRSTKVLKSALIEVLSNEGKDCSPFGDGKMKVKAVPAASVRAEFMKRYPADTIEPSKQSDAKRQAFNRAMKQAMDRDLIGAREIGGVDHLWLAGQD
jgi:hypothetical protein